MNATRKYPLLSLFLLSYAFTWWIAPLGSSNFPVFPYGPFIAVLVLVYASGGREGVRTFGRNAHRWRVDARWYVVAVLLPVVIAGSAILAARLLGAPASSVPGPESLIEFIVVLPLMILIGGPLGEELAWRGFALPLLQQRHRPLVAVLVLGIGQAIWHLPLFFTDEPPAVGPWLLGLLGGSIVLAWLWNATGAVLLPILLHGANNEAQQAFMLGFTEPEETRLAWLVATGWATAAAMIIWRTHGTLTPPGAAPRTTPLSQSSEPVAVEPATPSRAPRMG